MFGYTVILPPSLCTSDFVFALMAVNTCTILCVARYFLKCTGYRNMACDGDKTRGTITKVPGVDIVEL